MATQLHTFDKKNADAESRTHPILALFAMAVVLIAVPTMVGIIGYRSITIHTPSTALVVGGDSSLDGAKIEVMELAEPHRRLPIAWISRADEWQTPVLLDPGKYHISVTHHGTEILSEDFAPDRRNGVRFDLPSAVLIIGSRALADARVEVTYSGSVIPNSFHSVDLKFTPEGHYRQSVYLPAGEYRAIARTPAPRDQVLAQSDFVVDRANPIRIDLGKVYDEGTP